MKTKMLYLVAEQLPANATQQNRPGGLMHRAIVNLADHLRGQKHAQEQLQSRAMPKPAKRAVEPSMLGERNAGRAQKLRKRRGMALLLANEPGDGLRIGQVAGCAGIRFRSRSQVIPLGTFAQLKIAQR